MTMLSFNTGTHPGIPPPHSHRDHDLTLHHDPFQTLYDSLANLTLNITATPAADDDTTTNNNHYTHQTSAPISALAPPPRHSHSHSPQPAQPRALLPITPLFPPGPNVIFAHSSFFSRFTPAGTYPELPTPARVREEAARLGLVPAEGEEDDGREGRAKLVPFPELGLLVKYGPEVVAGAPYAGGGGVGVAPAEGKAMSLARRTLLDLGVPSERVPVPEVFGWRRDGETGERFVYMDLPEGEVLEERWAGMSEVEREGVCTQLREVVAEWRRLRLGGVGFVGEFGFFGVGGFGC